jgi:hypothetical protein
MSLDATDAPARCNKLTRFLGFATLNEARTPWARTQLAAKAGAASALIRVCTRRRLKGRRLEVVPKQQHLILFWAFWGVQHRFYDTALNFPY